MSEAAAVPAEAAPTEGDSAPVVEADPKAGINEMLKKSGIKLKAKDREYVPRDIDDLTSKANRVFGLESEIEGFKKEKGEAAQVKAWRAAIEADDENAAEQAFDSLSPRAQQNAARWLQKKYAAHEAEQKLPPEAVEARRMLEARERELREYKQRDEETRQQQQRQEDAKVLRETQEGVLKTVTTVMQALKADGTKSPRAPAALLPFAARHMRVAMMAEAETGAPVDPAEIAANVQRDVVEAFGTVLEGMPDDALYEAIGEAHVKRLLKAHLARVKGIKPGAKPAAKKVEPTKDPSFGTPAYLR